MRSKSSATLEPFLDSKPVRKIQQHKYAKGMFITINNHATYHDEIVYKLKKNYGSIWYWLKGHNINDQSIKLSAGKTPGIETILGLCAKKIPIMVAGIHNYNRYDKNIGRGSKWGIQYQHLHIFLYGIHHHLPSEEDKLNDKIDHLCKLLSRHNKRSKKGVKNFIDIKPVGIGKYEYSDIISPEDLHSYLNTPYDKPHKECVINYIADTTAFDGNKYPLSFLHKEVK
jgi:hypothetical protein